MRKILIIGNAGSGKSTLARLLAARLGIATVHLDQLYWRTGWQEAPRAEFLAGIDDSVARPAWIMDGNYTTTFERRMPAADTIIWLDMPRWLCLARILKRHLVNRGRVRADAAPGCPEKIDWQFLRFVWGYPKRSRPKTLSALSHYGPGRRVIVLRSRAEVRRFPASLSAHPE